MKAFYIVLINLVVVLSSQARLIEHKQTPSFSEIQSSIDSAISLHGWEKNKVLLVFDLDNTLLTMNQDFGGDAWFIWQEQILFSNSDPEKQVGKDFSELLTVQGYLYALSKMSPTEHQVPSIVLALQEKGLSLVLTSRGYDFRNSSERELSRNKLIFDREQDMILGSKGFAGKYKPYDINDPAKDGLTPYDMHLVENKKSRTVTYMDGLYLTAGQHKGVMLKALLHKLGYQPDAIFFVDDHKKHTDRMAAAYSNTNHSLYTYHYTGMKPKVDNFNDSDKQHVVKKWSLMKSVLEFLFH